MNFIREPLVWSGSCCRLIGSIRYANDRLLQVDMSACACVCRPWVLCPNPFWLCQNGSFPTKKGGKKRKENVQRRNQYWCRLVHYSFHLMLCRIILSRNKKLRQIRHHVTIMHLFVCFYFFFWNRWTENCVWRHCAHPSIYYLSFRGPQALELIPADFLQAGAHRG